jgi:hypothetical protein
MSDDPPIASEIATAKILCRESIPSDVGCSFDFDRSPSRAKLRFVPFATLNFCAKPLPETQIRAEGAGFKR